MSDPGTYCRRVRAFFPPKYVTRTDKSCQFGTGTIPTIEHSSNPILRTLFRRPQVFPWGREAFARSQTPVLWDQNLPVIRVRGQEFLRLRSGQVRATQAFSDRFRF